MTKPIYISTNRLLSITTGYLCLEIRDLVEAHIPSLAHLYVFMMSDSASTKCGIKTLKKLTEALYYWKTLFVDSNYVQRLYFFH